MLMAKVVSDLANRTPGKEAVAMESFAKALMMVRSCLLSFILKVERWDALTGSRRNHLKHDELLRLLFYSRHLELFDFDESHE